MADIFIYKTVAANSNLAIDVYLIGATHDLVITKLQWILTVAFTSLTYHFSISIFWGIRKVMQTKTDYLTKSLWFIASAQLDILKYVQVHNSHFYFTHLFLDIIIYRIISSKLIVTQHLHDTNFTRFTGMIEAMSWWGMKQVLCCWFAFGSDFPA